MSLARGEQKRNACVALAKLGDEFPHGGRISPSARHLRDEKAGLLTAGEARVDPRTADACGARRQPRGDRRLRGAPADRRRGLGRARQLGVDAASQQLGPDAGRPGMGAYRRSRLARRKRR